MSEPDFDAMLVATLDDGRMSRSERKALSAWMQDVQADEQTILQLRHRAFDIARQHAPGAHAASVIEWLEEAVKALSPPTPPRISSRACFSPGEQCYRAIAGEFATARSSADVCVFTITDDRLTRSILEAQRRGVRLRIITDNDKSADLGSDIDQLRSAGVVVREDRSPFHMHHKFAIFDNRTLLTGSYNWTRSAADSNEENLIVTDDPQLVPQFRREFDALWEKVA